MPDPLISVLMPTRNRPRLCEHAIRMVFGQTYPNLEIILVDDGDPDKRPSNVDDPRIRYVLVDRMGLGPKHDLALQCAHGEILAHWDDDDWFSPDRLAWQLFTMRECGYDLCGPGSDYVLTGDGRWWKFDCGGVPPSWIGNGQAGCRFQFHDGSAMFFRKSIPKGASYGTLTVGQKVTFLNAMIAGGVKWARIPNPGKFVYVRHQDNIWQFREDLVLKPAVKPDWFPEEDLAFYRGLGWSGES